jgi:hypothetical protein
VKILWFGKGRQPFEVGDMVSDERAIVVLRVEKIERGVLYGKSIYTKCNKELAVSDAFMVRKRRDK